MSRPTLRERWLRVGGALVSLGLLAAVGVALAGRMDELDGAGGLPSMWVAVAAVTINLLANLLLADTWRYTMEISGAPIPRGQAIWLWSSSQLARYVVALGQVGGRAVMVRRAGYSATAATVTSAVELLMFLAAAALLMVASLPAWAPGSAVPAWLLGAAILPLLAFVAALARPVAALGIASRLVALPVVPGVLRRRLEPLLEEADLTSRDLRELGARHAINTGLRLLVFLVVLSAAAPDGTAGADLLLTGTGAYAVGTFVGFVVIFAPGGLGVREATTSVLLSPLVGTGAALVTVATVRVTELIAELVLLGLAAAWRNVRAEAD